MTRNWWETRWFLAAALLLAAVPLLWPQVPPLTDLPGHIGRYRVMLGDDAAILGQWYRFEWRLVGNLGVDLLVMALAPLLGLEPAVKLIVIAIPVLSVAGMLWLSHELHGRVGPFALFALPLAYCYPFHFGFVNYTLAMALALIGWATWLWLGRIGRVGARAGLFVLFGMIVWLAHIMGWAMLCLFVFGGEWARARNAGQAVVPAAIRAVINCLPLAPPALLFLLWRSGEAGGASHHFFDLAIKIEGLATVLRDRWFLFDVGSLLIVLLLIYAALRGQIGRIERRAGAAAALVGIAVLALPFMLMGSAYADMRLIPYALIVALIGIAPRETMGRKSLSRIAMAGAGFFVIRIAATTFSLASIDHEWRRELAALDQLPRGSRVFALVGETCVQPWAHRRTAHLPALAIARRAAFSNDQWRMEGAPLMRVELPQAGSFAYDPAQFALSAPCESAPDRRPQAESLARFPRHAFTHVWLIQPHPIARGQLSGMTPLWRDGRSMLLRIDAPSRLPEARPVE